MNTLLKAQAVSHRFRQIQTAVNRLIFLEGKIDAGSAGSLSVRS